MNDKFWKWMAWISLGVALVTMVMLMLGRGLMTKGVLDFITPKEKITQTVNTTLLGVERESSLVTTRAFVQAVVRKSDEQWYGKAEVIRIVPATISYAVNLAEIDRQQIEYDDKARVLYVPLPEVKIHSIDPDMSKSEIIRVIGLLRSESLSGNVLEEATEKMVRPTLEEMGKSPEIIKTAKDQAVLSVRQLLESALNATGMQVQVRPYFKSEGKEPASVQRSP